MRHSGPCGGEAAGFVQALGTRLLVSGHYLCPSSLPCGVSRPVLHTKETGQGGARPPPSPAAVQLLPGASVLEVPFSRAGIRPTSFQNPLTLGVPLCSGNGQRELATEGVRGPSPGAQ